LLGFSMDRLREFYLFNLRGIRYLSLERGGARNAGAVSEDFPGGLGAVRLVILDRQGGLDAQMRQSLKRRVLGELGRFTHAVDRVSLIVSVEEGTGQGGELACEIVVQFPRGERLAVLESGPCLRTAAEQASARLRRTLLRKLVPRQPLGGEAWRAVGPEGR
jgi:hypothetical protein